MQNDENQVDWMLQKSYKNSKRSCNAGAFAQIASECCDLLRIRDNSRTGDNRKDAPETTIGLRKEVACISENCLWIWERVINLWSSYKRKIVNSLLVYRSDQGLLTSYRMFVKRSREFPRQTIGSLLPEGVT